MNSSEPMDSEFMAMFWEDVIKRHIPSFAMASIDQADNDLEVHWEAIVDSAPGAQKYLAGVLAGIALEVVCVDYRSVATVSEIGKSPDVR